MMTLFLNELYGFQLDNHRWYPLEIRKEKSTKDKKKRNIDEKLSGGSLDSSKASLIKPVNGAANDKEEKLNYDEPMDIDCNVDEMSLDLEKNMSVGDCDVVDVASDRKASKQNSAVQEIVKPCRCINSCMVVGRDTLYVYGGMMEVRDREITLADLYALNLSKLDEWKCLIAASESEWVEAYEDEDDDEDDEDDDEDDEDDDEDEDEEDNSESDSDDMEDDDDNNGVEAKASIGGSTSIDVGDAVSVIKGGKKLRRKEKRARIEQIRASLGLSHAHRTPMPGESLKDFYKRTNLYWQMAAYEHTEHTGKELRKDGFDFAESRYKELKPILDELAVLEAEQKAEEAEGPETSSRKRGNKKNKSAAAKK
ncbi:hypothetical protein OROMI_019596 [Orobanche minor]